MHHSASRNVSLAAAILSPVPSQLLSERLRQLGIGLLLQEHASLRAMVERGIGVRLPAGQSPDQLARILIELEEGKQGPASRSLIRQYMEYAACLQ